MALPAVGAAALTLFVLAQGITSRLTTACVEQAIHAVRLRIMGKLASATLQTFERISEGHLLTRLEKDLKVVSATSSAILAASQAGMLFLCSITYLAYLSPMAFGICMVVVVLSLLLHAIRMRVIHARMEAATQAETDLLGLTGHLVGGFKELKLHARRQRELHAELAAASGHSAERNRAAYVTVSDHLILIQIILYSLIGSVVFILPLLDTTQPLLLVKIVAVILFLAGALNQFAGILPMYTQADAAARHIEALEHQLTDEPAADGQTAQPQPAPVLAGIELEAVRYAYLPVNGQGFEVGPVNLSIRRGEIVFITGSNGSGKSTFLEAADRLAGARCRPHPLERQSRRSGQPRPLSRPVLRDLLGLPPVPDALGPGRAGPGRDRRASAAPGPAGPDRAERTLVLTAQALHRPAQAPRAPGGPAGRPAHLRLRRMGGRPGPGVPALVLSHGAATPEGARQDRDRGHP